MAGTLTRASRRLAIDGGTPLIQTPVPGQRGGPGVNAMDDLEVQAITNVLRAHSVFRHTPGSRTASFERAAASMLGVPYALMVNSGTSALVCALQALGVGPGDEVIVPAYTYIATAAAVVAVGAVPVIAEVDESLCLDPASLQDNVTPRTRAAIPVYMQGVPGRIDELMQVAAQAGIDIIEDCCQCIGGLYRGRHVGTFGRLGTWSLNYCKAITCGEGGLVFTSEQPLYERACYGSDPGFQLWMAEGGTAQEWKEPPFAGGCYRASELSGALALVQIGKLDDMLAHTRALKRAFLEELAQDGSLAGLSLQHVDDPEGDCGLSACMFCRTADDARRYARAIRAEGAPCGTIHADGFPDRHIYCYWDSILNRNSPDGSGRPWTDPAYTQEPRTSPPGAAYSRDMCPRTLDLLDRALRFSFNLAMTPSNARQIAAAVRLVDRELA